MIVETLHVFITVSELKNFSRAAEVLNLSQPGVSLHIRNLENELGAKLLHRSPKLVKLTEAGEILYKRAKVILALYDEAKQDIFRLHHTVSGSLQVGASFTIGEYILPRLIAEFVDLYPQVDMGVTIGNTEEIVQAVRLNTLDLGLVEGNVSATDLIVTPYMKDEMILVAAADHPLSSLRLVETNLLQNQIWVLRENGSGTREYCEQFIQQSAIHIQRSYVFNSSQGVKEAVAAGLGIAMLSRLVVRKELETGEISEIIIKGSRLDRDFSLIRKQDHAATMSADVFMQKLLAQD